MECTDRISMLVVERELEPVRMLAGLSAPAEVTVRALLMRRRFDVTIRKLRPGASRRPAFAWEVREVEEGGVPAPEGLVLRSSSADGDVCGDPEDAYWSALDATRARVHSARALARP